MACVATLHRWAAVACFAALCTAAPACGQERPIALRGATVETIAQGRIDEANIIVRGGKIEAVGTDAEIPGDARVIDAAGFVVMPGIVDPLSRIGFGTAGPGGGGRQQAAAQGASFTRAADIFYPYQRVYRTLPPSGITTLSLTPGGFGQAAVVRLITDEPDAMLLEADGVLCATVTHQTSSLDVIRNGLKRAKSGGRTGQRRPSRGRSRASAPATETPGQRRTGGMPSAAAKLWSEVVAGERFLVVSASGAAAIAHLAAAVEPYEKVKLAVTASGPVLYQALEPLMKCKARILVSPTIDLRPNSRDRINVPRELHAAGLEFAFTPSADLSTLRATQDAPLFPVAYLVQTGLPRGAALKALTLGPAEVLGLDDRLGSIEPKKDANLLVFRGEPLDPSSRLVHVMVEGRTVYEN